MLNGADFGGDELGGVSPSTQIDPTASVPLPGVPSEDGNQITVNTGTIPNGGISVPSGGVGGESYIWTVRVMVENVDVTESVTGQVEVDREANAAGVAQFTLFFPEMGVNPVEWRNDKVEIYFIRLNRDGSQVAEWLVFTGYVVAPSWDAVNRYLTCECSDNRQSRIEAMTFDEIDALIPAPWSSDVWGPKEEIESHWDYADQRLQAVQADLDCDVDGTIRLTPWRSEEQATIVIGDGTCIDGSIAVDVAASIDAPNTVDIEFQVRNYKRWQRLDFWDWEAFRGMTHTSAESGPDLCTAIRRGGKYPTEEMITSAVESQDLTMMLFAGTYIPLGWTAIPEFCPNMTGFYHYTDDVKVYLSAEWITSKKWVQAITDNFTVRLQTTETSTAPDKAIVSRLSFSIDFNNPEYDEWPDKMVYYDDSQTYVPGGVSNRSYTIYGERIPDYPTGYVADIDTRFEDAFNNVLAIGHKEIVSAYRQNLVTWSMPSPMCMGVDLVHTIKVESPGVNAQGKCARIKHTFDIESGGCISDISIAVSHGGSPEGDPVEIPPVTLDPFGNVETSHTLSSQFGDIWWNDDGETQYPDPYDENKYGLSSNFGNGADETTIAERFEFQFTVPPYEIPAEDTDEKTTEQEFTYTVGIVQDLLEM